MEREDEIRLIAYKIWEEEGCIDGHDCEHWYRAEVIWEQGQKEKAVMVENKANPKQAVTQKSMGKNKPPKKSR